MIVTHERVLNCSGITSQECLAKFLTKLGHGLGFKLRADVPTDEVHGSVSISHGVPPAPHVLVVEVYEEDMPPEKPDRPGKRLSSLKRPATFPSAQSIKDKLDT